MLLKSLILFTASIITVQGALVPPTGLPDGQYLQILQEDGTRITKSLDSARADIVSHNAADAVSMKPRSALFRRSLQKRDGGCFGYMLDSSGVDKANVLLQQWCGPGHDLKSGAGNYYYFSQAEGMMAYYCIDAPNSLGNCDINDVKYAFGQMDAMCKRYEASWFKWPGSFEIIGKDRVGANVCV